MAGIRLNVHREWEDWLGILLGVLVGFSPWLAGAPVASAIAWNAVLIGTLLVALNALELVDLRRWEEAGEIAAGFWIAISPVVFGYAGGGMLRLWQYALGAAVIALAAFELWQDWNRTDRQLARHGR